MGRGGLRERWHNSHHLKGHADDHGMGGQRSRSVKERVFWEYRRIWNWNGRWVKRRKTGSGESQGFLNESVPAIENKGGRVGWSLVTQALKARARLRGDPWEGNVERVPALSCDALVWILSLVRDWKTWRGCLTFLSLFSNDIRRISPWLCSSHVTAYYSPVSVP